MGRRLAVLATIFGFTQGNLYAEDWVATLQTAGRYVAVETRGSLAFFASEWGFEIFSIADPADPVRLSSTPTPGIADELEIDDRYAYVGDSGNALLVFDCLDPAAPVKVAEIPLSLLGYPGTRFLDLLRVDTILYAAIRGSDSGVYILNIADPPNIYLTSAFRFSSSPDTPTVPFQFVHLDTLLYVADYRGLWVADISDPGHPTTIGSYRRPSGYWEPECAAAGNGRLFMGDLWLRRFDITDPTSPVYNGFQIPSDTSDSWLNIEDLLVSDTFLILAAYAKGVKIANFPPNPADSVEVRSLFDTPSLARAIALFDSLLIVADGDRGVEAASWSTGASDSLGYYESRGFTELFAKVGRYLLIARSLGCYVVDISLPRSPVIVDSVITDRWVWSAKAHGNRLFVVERGRAGASFNTRLLAFDLNDTLNPQLLGTYVSPRDSLGLLDALSWNFATDGEFTYHADRIFSIVDVRRPDSMYLAGRVPGYFPVPGSAPRLGPGRAYTVFEFYSYVIDISNPFLPDVLNPSGSLLSYSDAIVEDSLLYGSTGEGVRVLNVLDPLNIYETGNWSSDVPCGSLERGDNRLFVARGTAGWALLQIPEPHQLLLETFGDTPGSAGELLADDSMLFIGDAYGLTVIRLGVSMGVDPGGDGAAPTLFELTGNYPNPSNSGTVIRFSLPSTSNVTVRIHNALGRLVAKHDLGICRLGLQLFRWNGRDNRQKPVPSGVYFYRVSTGNKTLTGKMVLLK